MLYALNTRGKMLLFTGKIQPEDYGLIEQIASAVSLPKGTDDLGLCMNKLKDALLGYGISIIPVKVERVFRPARE